ncbi:MAG TPA: hypothetical protein PLO37_04735 [Candidatus Hydrogenedentes bacterium]|nr:hypothetical protein [Candidatus Hydrogenedentota bacterium]
MPELSPHNPCERLAALAAQADLHFAHAPRRYDPGHVLDVEIMGVCPASRGHARLRLERYVGSGFAGQVYQARLIDVAWEGEPVADLDPDGLYAVKICVPRSGFSRRFRDLIYWLGYQSAFPYQVNPAAARAGVLWQKLVRRAAAIRLGDDRCVADTYATFFDGSLGSHGEINEWVDGRNWRFEIDDRVFDRGRLKAENAEASREYLAKKAFMAELVRLLHEMGAPEFARQYEWWTAKSQPNVVKRLDAGDGPAEGLTALDFRAGLALLPYLPMSPADFVLIVKGMKRGDLVQFDRGDLAKLEVFCDAYEAEFADLRPALDELKTADPTYRAQQPDLTHHGIRLFSDRELRHTVKTGLVHGWHVKGLVDEEHAWRLTESVVPFWLFYCVGCLPLFGKRIRRYWGHAGYRRHIRALFSSRDYLRRTFRALMCETLADWYRDDRVDMAGIERYVSSPFLFFRISTIMRVLPFLGRWQRFLTDWGFARRVVAEAFLYPIRFYRDADFRVAWLTGEIEAGAAEGMLTSAEKEAILARVPDPFIQKYLKCVAVHVCTLPVTQVVSVIIAIWGFFYLGKSWQEGLLWAGAILAAFQGTPISPGSITRGTYVVYLMIRERNVRNYWLAVLVSYWHYIGYLGFPLQMVKEFPSLARFMGGRWATKMVGFIPVFGERGALLEHWVFDTFFNVPLTVKRRFTRTSSGGD